MELSYSYSFEYIKLFLLIQNIRK